jgi:hypothetical protein
MNPFEAMNIAAECSQEFIEQTEQQNAVYQDPVKYSNYFDTYKSEPKYYQNPSNFISPYDYDNWGGISGIIATFDESTRTPIINQDNKIDPNKIYTSELAALRSSAADQVRITKLFEKKLMESLKDKDKFGLNENDILAMQSLTSAKSALTAITKEIIGVKKNISELRVKQQQFADRNPGGMVDGGVVPTTSSSIDNVRLLDSIFQSSISTPIDVDNIGNNFTDEEINRDIDRANSVIDSVLPIDEIDPYIRNERRNPKVVVEIDESGDLPRYVTYADNGEVLDNYPPPAAKIVNIDRDKMIATDSTEREYPVIIKK